ncbi:molybdenum ABC transporter periplasmic molybdate-binding protein [Tolypothrix tenuis PCC 7101]|uniref:Molybdenum ABC transporter periplasmic molybdate-binding protein n=1 Tax=Tolypothrix tenuis PCC 7101 TaxID=231146 RepID=A0A1Z4N2K0_9CYAN|nr:molybdate ABC transporter substrate-binding protein [Aulosira sp. FACHB-113]BAY99924.1 molybdenum ABC transporter periplasmic molybdate-binding protein [Tolypothrix tenuis PCC 7101]BAZ76154.1 molybdenum ABC transporter periplasmic molybdate-binding protein [Aulosira laxa NIES-50]
MKLIARPLRRYFFYLSLLVVTLALTFIPGILPTIAQQANAATLTVSAGAGLKPVLEDVQKVYKQQQPNINITYNFAASGVLQRQIEQGANIDVFIAASTKNMNELQQQGLLLSETRKNLIKSRIALIASKNTTGISSFQDLNKQIVKKIAIGEPRSVPLGMYAEEVFKYLGITEQVKPKLVYARSALEIVTFVESGNVDVGIVHDTTVKTSDKVKILALAPEAAHSPVVYPVAVLKNSKNQVAAKSFVQFLFSKKAKSLYKNYGYTLP